MKNNDFENKEAAGITTFYYVHMKGVPEDIIPQRVLNYLYERRNALDIPPFAVDYTMLCDKSRKKWALLVLTKNEDAFIGCWRIFEEEVRKEWKALNVEDEPLFDLYECSCGEYHHEVHGCGDYEQQFVLSACPDCGEFRPPDCDKCGRPINFAGSKDNHGYYMCHNCELMYVFDSDYELVGVHEVN